MVARKANERSQSGPTGQPHSLKNGSAMLVRHLRKGIGEAPGPLDGKGRNPLVCTCMSSLGLFLSYPLSHTLSPLVPYPLLSVSSAWPSPLTIWLYHCYSSGLRGWRWTPAFHLALFGLAQATVRMWLSAEAWLRSYSSLSRRWQTEEMLAELVLSRNDKNLSGSPGAQWGEDGAWPTGEAHW